MKIKPGRLFFNIIRATLGISLCYFGYKHFGTHLVSLLFIASGFLLIKGIPLKWIPTLYFSLKKRYEEEEDLDENYFKHPSSDILALSSDSDSENILS